MKYLIIIAVILLAFSCREKNAATIHKNGDTHNLNVEKKAVSTPNEIQLNAQQVQLGNIQVDTVQDGTLSNQVILAATLTVDEQKINAISSRVMGRIERLYFKNIGDYVHKGDKLYDIYSEELNNAKEEYALAMEKGGSLDHALVDFSVLIQSAKNKLLLWGLSSIQIQELENNAQSPITTFYSPYSGSLTSSDIKEGEYSMEGGTILRITDLSSLWAEGQRYSSQMAQVNKNTTATLTFPDIPGKIIYGKLEFITPEPNPQSRITLLRVNVDNKKNILQPGMAAYVTIRNKETNSITIPTDAVLRTEMGATVWLQTGERTYASKMIEIGFEDGDRVQVKSGLKNNDIVVVAGAYLINSEFRFRNGSNPMQGMKM